MKVSGRAGKRDRGNRMGAFGAATLVTLVMAGAGLPAAAAAGGLRLGKPHPYSSGTGDPGLVALADMNRDGRKDIVFGTTGGTSTGMQLGALYGKKGGGFKAVDTLASGPSLAAMDVGDVNGDKRPDVATAADSAGGGAAQILESKPGGGYKKKDLPGADYADAVVIADVNRDGKPDLVYGSGIVGDIDILLGDGHGGFAAPTYAATEDTPLSLDVHDFTGDGKPDLIALEPDSAYGSVLALLAGDGHGGFAIDTTYILGHPSAKGIATGDFNSDGRLDVGITSCGAGYNYLLLGKKHGLSGAGERQTDTSSCAEEPAAGDLSGDGLADLASGTYGSQENTPVLVNEGTGAGRLAPDRRVSTRDDGFKSHLAIGRINGDKRNDLVVTSSFNQEVIVLYGTRK